MYFRSSYCMKLTTSKPTLRMVTIRIRSRPSTIETGLHHWRFERSDFCRRLCNNLDRVSQKYAFQLGITLTFIFTFTRHHNLSQKYSAGVEYNHEEPGSCQQNGHRAGNPHNPLALQALPDAASS
jgi:hypothetical protein